MLPSRNVAINIQVLQLESLVRMKLTSFRLRDRVHLLDMIDVGFDRCHVAGAVSCRFWASALQELLDNPEG